MEVAHRLDRGGEARGREPPDRFGHVAVAGWLLRRRFVGKPADHQCGVQGLDPLLDDLPGALAPERDLVLAVLAGGVDEDEGRDPFRVVEGEGLRDLPAERHPAEVHPLDAERILEARHVGGQHFQAVGTGRGVAPAVAPGVVAEHPEALESGEVPVPVVEVAPEAVVEADDRRALGPRQLVRHPDLARVDSPERHFLSAPAPFVNLNFARGSRIGRHRSGSAGLPGPRASCPRGRWRAFRPSRAGGPRSREALLSRIPCSRKAFDPNPSLARNQVRQCPLGATRPAVTRRGGRRRRRRPSAPTCARPRRGRGCRARAAASARGTPRRSRPRGGGSRRSPRTPR